MKETIRLPHIDHKKCTLCGQCVEICPQHVLALRGGKVIITSPADCAYCATCEGVCPQGAIRVDYQIAWA